MRNGHSCLSDIMKKDNEYIELLDGTSLPCYPKVEEDLEMDGNHFSAAVSRYFILGRYIGQGMEKSIPLRELFWENASALYDVADRILSDSRLFFVPIPSLDDYGEGETREPTFRILGMYAELWKSCPEATIPGKDGSTMVCYDWSPYIFLVGKNGVKLQLKSYAACGAIMDKAHEIKYRYKGLLQKYQCYSLLQVLAMLEQEGRIVIPDKAHIIYRLTNELSRLDNVNRQVVRDRTRMKLLFHNHLIQEKEQELRLFLEKMNAKKAEVDAVVDDAHDKRVALRIKLRNGELTPKRYEGIWKPINRKKKVAVAAYNRFVDETLRTLFPIERITLKEVEDYLYDKKEENSRYRIKF